jgi:hypothetical protein
MNDREIERLIGMAGEAEDLERSVDAPLRLVGHGPRRWIGLGAATAAAASLLAAFVIMQNRIVTHRNRTMAGATQRGRNAAGATGTTGAAVDPDQCVVMAVYKGADGKCSCLNLNRHEWGGRSLADVNKRELLDAAFREACTTDVHQVLVVAVEGKAGTLPQSREEAEAIAAKLADAPATGRVSDLSSYAYAAMPRLSPGATVVAEQVAVRRSPLTVQAVERGAEGR